MKKIFFTIFTVMFIASVINAKTLPNVPPVVKSYVTLNGAGSKNGTSWLDAYDNTQLQTAINSAGISEVWVAAGTYKPTTGTDRSISFQMKNGVAIYGGFAGTEINLSERDIVANPTILSGDIGNPNDNSDNSYHVFYHPDGLALTNSAILDGFTVTNGNADAAAPNNNGAGMYNNNNSPTIKNCIFTSNTAKNGSAMFNISNSNPVLVNCEIKNNQATESGGGGFWIHDGCEITLTNCLIHDNTSPTWGGGMIILTDASASLINCTLSQNGSSWGGGLYNAGGIFVINNSILWGNTSVQWGNQIETTSGISTTLNYSCFANVYGPDTWDVEGTVTANYCTNNNPHFIDSDVDDYRIFGLSPVVDAGNSEYVIAPNPVIEKDIRNKNRINGGSVDIGCYEFTYPFDPYSMHFFVNENASGSNTGLTWNDAFTTLQPAFDASQSGDSIFVAGGTYFPTSYNGLDPGSPEDIRLKHFRMKEGVVILGSFVGNEDVNTYDFALRDFSANRSVLSGDIGVTGDSTDNCYHVFYHPDGLGLTNAAELNGFEITGGQATGADPHYLGGGMLNYFNSPLLNHVLFRKNYAANDGGGLYNDNSSPAVLNCFFVQNKCSFSGAGLVTRQNSNPEITNTIFAANDALYGGAVYTQNSNPVFNTCTFAGNNSYIGGGILAEGDTPSQINVNNSILWANSGWSLTGEQIFVKEQAALLIDHSCYQNLSGDIFYESTFTPTNCIYGDPLFVSPFTGDFRICGNSPCKDAGDNTSNTQLTDFRGMDRVQNSTIDMGAYEFSVGTDPYIPTLTITNPIQGAVVYSNPVTFSGTAADGDVNLSEIQVKLNSGTWQTATGTTTWTIDLTLEPGINTIFAKAKDATDLYSEIDTVVVTLSIQKITIPQGWSYISSYLNPTNPNIVNMWADIVGANHLGILTGVQGIYAPAPFYINTLGSWNVMKGYKVKMNAADDLIVSGDSLTDKTVTFPAGVHLIPVLTNQTTSIEDVFVTPATDILYMLDIYTNQVYWPNGVVYTLTELVPGKGYLANFKNPVTLTYPPMTNFTVDVSPSLPPAPGPWSIVRTSNYHLISVSTEVISQLPDADFIGAFDASGKCVGYAELEKTGRNILLTIYGDEPMTPENDGLAGGEVLHFRSYRLTDNAEKELTPTYNPSFPNTDGLFFINGLSGISGFKESATGVGENDLAASVLVYPNPATDVLNIVVPTPLTVHEASGLSAVEGNLLTAEGKLVKTFTITSPETQLDVSGLQPGIYLLKIASSQNIVIKRVIIQ